MLPQSQEHALQFAMKLQGSRHNWDDLFERLALMFLPNRVGFQSTYEDGEDLQDHLNSSAPVLARRSLASAVSVMLRPPGRAWFDGKVKFEALNDDPQVRMWLEQVSRIMYAYMYDPRSKMESNLAMADDDLVTFGNACVRVGWDSEKLHLKYRVRPMSKCYYVVNAVGDVIGIVTFETWTVRQLRDRFGDTKLSKDMKKDLSKNKPDLDREYEIVHVCIPVADAKAMGMPFKQPYSSLWMSTKCKHTLESKGYDWFPYLTPRWDLSTGETYGRSPAMVALGDAQLLQAMTETMIDAGEKVLNPAMWGFGDFINGQFDISAGAFNPIDPSGMMGNYPPVNTIQTGTLPKEIFEFMNVVEERIGAAFYRDILELPSARDADLTATEINARLDQYMRQAPPVFSRIEASYNAPHVMLVYRILSKNGVLPPKPEKVQQFEEFAGEEAIEFDYESPIKVARDKTEAMKILEGIGMVLQGAAQFGEQAVMTVAENFNPDAIARGLGPKLDLPEWVFTPMEEMMKMREQRMQAQQQMAQAEMAGKAAPALSAAAQAGKLIPDAANAGLIEAETPYQLPAPDEVDFGGIEGMAGAIESAL